MKCELSVIIPAYNAGAYLDECINSVLSQTLFPSEIILIDDGSEDDTEIIVKKYPTLSYVKTKNLGCAHARNLGVNLAKYDFLAFLDADDIWEKCKLEVQLGELKLKSELLISHTKAVNYLDHGMVQAPVWTEESTYDKDGFTAFIPSTLLVRKEIFSDKKIYFDTSYLVGSDMDWFVRIKDQGLDVLMVDMPLTRRRIHLNNLGHKLKENKEAKLRVLSSSIKRKKQIES